MGMGNKYTATVLGATGVVGRSLVNLLCQDERYERVICLVRSPLKSSDYHDPLNKIEPLVIDFDQLQDYQGYFSTDHIYCCLGTTLKAAGSRKAFRRVDFEFVHVSAQLARAQRAKSFVWISSLGADAKSRSFYLKVKGELENAIMQMPQLPNAAAVRPSILDADRKGERPAEQWGLRILKALSPIMLGPLKKYRPSQPFSVASEMIRLQQF